ncbi:programmed cell death protein 7 [Notolabrus celidotus]|uniref:programmed cell death protein 7 n=1 Tax=Notolabrus celidotus TaxID=1203425 RepID=UPI0014905BD4|nr:programmed cell death protein 7 [Notolabrus celidotus]
MEHTQQPPDYYSGYQDTPYPVNRPPYGAAPQAATQPDPSAPQWPPTPGYDLYGFRYDLPAMPPGAGGGGFGGPHFPPPFGFDPSVPPPPLGCPPPGLFPSLEPPAPLTNSPFQPPSQQFRPGPQSARYDLDSGQSPLHPQRGPDRGPGTQRRAEDDADLQRTQDQQWIRRFLQSRGKICLSSQTKQPRTVSDQQPRTVSDLQPRTVSDLQPRTVSDQHSQQSVPELRRSLSRAAQLVSQLTETCESLRSSIEEDSEWTQSYSGALKVKDELQDLLVVLRDSERLACWKTKLSRISERRSRKRRSRRLLQLEEQQREERSAEKEAAIDRWRLQQIQQVEERKKELEVKRAADSVLCEVRKKQTDVKRMQDVLRSVEKLRKLRKEAASRKGILTEPECDDAFRERVEQLRGVMKRRTAVYCVEEKALRVMLEGEQEEERRREQERKGRKERERQLKRRSRAQAMLFGEDFPADTVLQPFTQFHTQAERSLLALLHIRREWDMFVVVADHPDGSPVPQAWVIPDPPSDQVWASSLQTDDTQGDKICV